MQSNGTQLSTAQSKSVEKKIFSHSERFTQAIEKEFSSGPGEINLTRFQRKLCQNYFIKIDSVLKDAEKKRLAKTEKFRDALAFTWENINMPRLAVDVITFSSVGLDPTQPNHINTIPYKNTSNNKYDMVFIMGYKGVELKATKYGYKVPDDVIVELVYANDKFKQLKKDKDNKIENYSFEVVDDFNRGEIVGGFYYHDYFNEPQKNKIKVFTRADIEKRKPDYASAEFWGGEKDKWERNEETGKNVKAGKETVEGWYDEMAYKTIYKAAYNSITIDSEKIDENYLKVIQIEQSGRDLKIFNEIKENGNKKEIGFPGAPVKNTPVVNKVSESENITDENLEFQMTDEENGEFNEENGPGF